MMQTLTGVYWSASKEIAPQDDFEVSRSNQSALKLLRRQPPSDDEVIRSKFWWCVLTVNSVAACPPFNWPSSILSSYRDARVRVSVH